MSLPTEWLSLASSASAPVYNTPERQNPEFFHILPGLCPRDPASLIVDVGANMGTYVLNFRSIVPSQILAFEPNPAIYDLLVRNVHDNCLKNVETRNVACGDVAGELSFQPSINGNIVLNRGDGPRRKISNSIAIITVPVVRLDDELADRKQIGLIKIDCEGFEYNILMGALETIKAHRPVLFVELHPTFIGGFGHNLREVCDLLRPSYVLKFWDMGRGSRIGSRFARVANRYWQSWNSFDRCLEPLADEAEMHARANGANAPDQLFMLAVPRE